MNLLILHLSDIHIKTSQDKILGRGDSIGRASYKNLAGTDGVVVLITGDIAYSGKKDEYTLAQAFLKDIIKCIKSEKDIPIHVLMCPGNHDCDFEAGEPDIREIVLDNIRKTPPEEIKDSIIKSCTNVQKMFFEFRDSFVEAEPIFKDELWQSHKITLNGHSILFHLLNVAWMSKIREDSSSIVFPIKRFESVVDVASEVTILAFHHPMHWFSLPIYRSFRTFTRKAAQIILTGHEHIQTAGITEDTEAGECVCFEGGVLQEINPEISKFNMVLLDLETQEYSIEFHQWDGNHYVPVELESAWSSFRRLPEKRRSEFQINADFSNQLSDAGARFRHHGRTEDLTLDDVYVYPEMRPVSEDDKGRLVIDAAMLRNPEKLKSGVLVHGREQYGKTSLLKQLFRSYHERGFVPVFLTGKELTKSTPRDLEKIIERAVTNSYQHKKVLPLFWQAGKERRVLLIDDLDDSELSGKYFSNALEYLNSVFGLMLITCSELFEFREYVSSSSLEFLNKLDHYSILEFGFRRRLELIKRWASLGGNILSPEKTIATIDQIEKFINSVIGESVVPSTPFFMLTLLQSAEVGSPANLQQSALADYYRYLIIHSLEIQKVSRDEHAEILNYCSHLAWFISQSHSNLISVAALTQFHNQFVDRHGLSLNFVAREKLLRNAKLLEKFDEGYGFSYPYLYYYFLGKYLAEHLDEEVVQSLIRDCCKKLHNQDSSNIVLFLAHHSRDKRVYESILSVLKAHFTRHAPVNLDNDVDVVNQLVQSAPELIFVDSDPLENRVEVRKLQDESDEERRELLNNSDSLPAEVVEIISLVRTVDILGQFLRNHYGQLDANVKEQLLKELFDGGLRGLRDFLEMLVEHSDGLIRSIENVIEKHGLEKDITKRNNRAKQEMFKLLGMVTFGIIKRCGVSVASPHLAPMIDLVVEKTPSTAYRLIATAIDMERQGGLDDLNKLNALNQDIKSNSFAQWILKQLVFAHMHMYSTTIAQKQKVCSELKIEIQDQRLLDFQTKDSKRKSH